MLIIIIVNVYFLIYFHVETDSLKSHLVRNNKCIIFEGKGGRKKHIHYELLL